MPHKGWHSRGYLPHFDSAETVQFVTFRLFDSLPKAVAEMLAKHPNNLAETDASLDRGTGACWLKEPALATLVQAWKSFTAHRANSTLGRKGPFWHKDYFDRFICDEGHLERTISYIENNPLKAGLDSSPELWPWSSAHRA
jgi:hypothetical protein